MLFGLFSKYCLTYQYLYHWCNSFQTIITVAFNPLNSHDKYELQWKEYPQVRQIESLYSCLYTEMYLIFIPNHLRFTFLLVNKQPPCIQKWESEGQSKAINAKEVTRTGNNKIQTNIEDLNPGTTYTVRLRVLSAVASESESPTPGKPSPELIIDTEAVSCTPKASQCVIC